MALPDLLRALRAQAAERRNEELARADAEAERVRVASRTAIEGRRREYLERTDHEEKEAARRAVSQARTEAAASVLAARDRLLGRVAAALEARVDGAASDSEYLIALPQEIRDGLGRLPAGPVVVRTRPELSALVRDAVRDRDRVDVVTTTAMGAGFTASAEASGVEVDGTLRTRLAYSWSRVAVSVLREVSS